jgi:serine/threonine-protein kinase
MVHTKGNGSSEAPRTSEAQAEPAAVAGPKTSPPASERKRRPSLADMLIGTVLADRYKLVSRIGEGAMGWVFLAEHTEIGKKCAVKVLRPALCRMPEAVQRFRREARAATQIGSKHIVDVTDFGATPNGAAFMVMELLRDGEDLGSTLKKHGRLPWERVVDIVIQCCDALQAAHDEDIIHRDVKPANIYRFEHEGKQDFIKVLDFGIARLATAKDSIVTATGVVMGTPDYMAPEQAQGRHVDHRADIYSLGATAYALVTGRPPFTGKNEYDVIYKQLNEDPKPPSSVAKKSEIPKWLDDAILKSMAKDPDARFQSMREFGEKLSKGLEGVVDFEPPAPEVSAPESASASSSGAASVEKASHTDEKPRREALSPRARSQPKGMTLSPVMLAVVALALAGLGAFGVWVFRTYF